jgi:hypothetical protein
MRTGPPKDGGALVVWPEGADEAAEPAARLLPETRRASCSCCRKPFRMPLK